MRLKKPNNKKKRYAKEMGSNEKTETSTVFSFSIGSCSSVPRPSPQAFGVALESTCFVL
ncbi:Uncharacterized protein APZ42_021715 [Daphnia magna]|uniref:Uncharacterized protein n=1 Tax=Daphnia magna TaxID=35525 RepID=A0A164WFY8_9CRUS|nr:Uncharacterized protein APZ42_021715 [Daphnia magna]